MGRELVRRWVRIGAYNIWWEKRWWSIIWKDHMMERAWYLPDKYPETRKDRSNSDWSALLIIIWCDDGVIWHNDDMTNQSRWSLSYFSIRRDIVSILSSNHFSSQHLNNHQANRPLLCSTCRWSTAVLSSLPVDWTPLLGLLQGGLEVTTRQDNRYVETNLVSFWWRLICSDLDPWYGLYWPPPNPGVQDLGNGQLSLGASPFQPWRTWEAQRTGANWPSPTILVENH